MSSYVLQVSQMKFKDGRLKLMNELLNGIKVSARFIFIFRAVTKLCQSVCVFCLRWR